MKKRRLLAPKRLIIRGELHLNFNYAQLVLAAGKGSCLFSVYSPTYLVNPDSPNIFLYLHKIPPCVGLHKWKPQLLKYYWLFPKKAQARGPNEESPRAPAAHPGPKNWCGTRGGPVSLHVRR